MSPAHASLALTHAPLSPTQAPLSPSHASLSPVHVPLCHSTTFLTPDHLSHTFPSPILIHLILAYMSTVLSFHALMSPTHICGITSPPTPPPPTPRGW